MTTEAAGTICPGSGQFPDTNCRIGADSAYCPSCGALKTVRGRKLVRHYSVTPRDARYLAERAGQPRCEALVEKWGMGSHNEPCRHRASATIEVRGKQRQLCGTHAGVAKRGGWLTLGEGS